MMVLTILIWDYKCWHFFYIVGQTTKSFTLSQNYWHPILRGGKHKSYVVSAKTMANQNGRMDCGPTWIGSWSVIGYCRGGAFNDMSIKVGKDVEQGNDGVRAGLGNKHGKHTRCTQIRGPRGGVTPLLLHVWCIWWNRSRATWLLLELCYSLSI